jgi:hypothetical protein
MDRVRKVFVITSGLDPQDPRSKLAQALRSKGHDCSVIRCNHAQPPAAPRDGGGEDALSGGEGSAARVQYKLRSSCHACHQKVWKHVFRTSGGLQAQSAGAAPARDWVLVIDLAALSFNDTNAIVPWVQRLPWPRISSQGFSMVLLRPHAATYLISPRGVYGMLLKTKGRHPQEYGEYLRPCLPTAIHASMIGALLDALGFEALTCFLSQNILASVGNAPPVTYLHLIALALLVANFRYTRSFVVTILCIIEILLLTLLSDG